MIDHFNLKMLDFLKSMHGFAKDLAWNYEDSEGQIFDVSQHWYDALKRNSEDAFGRDIGLADVFASLIEDTHSYLASEEAGEDGGYDEDSLFLFWGKIEADSEYGQHWFPGLLDQAIGYAENVSHFDAANIFDLTRVFDAIENEYTFNIIKNKTP